MPLETTEAVALKYLKRGWWVLPLKPGEKIPETSLVPHGVADSSNDPAVIARWFEGHPERGIGIDLKRSKLVCIDIDTHGGFDGHSTFERIEHEHGYGSMDTNAVQETPSGGEHRLYSNPDGLSFPGKFFPEKGNIDLKSSGYICAYPSTRSDCDGVRYEWTLDGDPTEHGDPIAPIPKWMVDELARKPAPEIQPQGPAPATCIVTQRTWAEIVSALSTLSSDDREDWVNVGMALAATHHPDAFAVWDRWSKDSPKYNPRDCARVWASFTDRGFSGVSYKSIFKMARDGGGWRGLTDEQKAVFEQSKAADAERHQYAEAAPEPEKRQRRKFALESLDDLQQRADNLRFMIDGYFPLDSIGCVFGASGSGKSFVAITVACCVAAGVDWCGKKTEQGKVLYIAAEGGAGQKKRVDAWLAGHPECKEAVFKNLQFITDPTYLADDAEDIAESLKEAGFEPTLVIVDTVSQTFKGDENSASDMAQYIHAADEFLRKPTGACVILVHHSGKDSGKGARGSSVIRANTSFLYEVKRNGADPSNTVECIHQKDFDLGAERTFTWTRVDLGERDGIPVSSIRLDPIGVNGQPGSQVYAQKKPADGMLPHKRLLLDLTHQMDDREKIRTTFVEKLIEQGKARNAARMLFKRDLDELREARLVQDTGKKIFAIDGFEDPERPW